MLKWPIRLTIAELYNENHWFINSSWDSYVTVITIHGAKRDDSNELPGGRIFTNDMYSQDDLGAILLI